MGRNVSEKTGTPALLLLPCNNHIMNDRMQVYRIIRPANVLSSDIFPSRPKLLGVFYGFIKQK